MTSLSQQVGFARMLFCAAGLGAWFGAVACSSDPGAGANAASGAANAGGAAAASSGAGGAATGGTTGSASGGMAPAFGGTTATGGTAGSATAGGTAGSAAAGGIAATSGGTAAAGGSSAGAGGSAPSGGAGGAAPTGGSGGVVGSIGNLSIEPNPNSVLSVFVSWTTAEPSSSLVQFGEGELTWEIDGEAGVTEHRVLVIGMHASTAYQIRAISTGPSGTVQADGTYTTAALPSLIPAVTISTYDAARAQPGWTLMNVQKGDGSNRALSGGPPAAVIFDEAGKPVWYFINGTTTERGGAISVDRTDLGVLMGPADTRAPIEVDWAGNELWTCEDLRCGGSAGLSHHAGKLSNGNYIIMRDAQSGSRISQVFEEHTPTGEVVHTIGVEDAVTPPGNASGDWAHGNFIGVDLQNDIAYMSFRWLGLVKMTYSTKAFQWHLPASYGASGLGNMDFVPADSQFSDIHDPSINADGTILFFDNGGYTGQIQDGNPSNLHTRAVEYQLDEQALTATLVWEWPGDFDTDPWYKEQLYVPFWGDADRLANGNVMITAGRRGVAEVTPESRVIEVTKDTGEVVWELRFPKDYGVFRSERLFPLPLVRKIAP